MNKQQHGPAAEIRVLARALARGAQQSGILQEELGEWLGEGPWTSESLTDALSELEQRGEAWQMLVRSRPWEAPSPVARMLVSALVKDALQLEILRVDQVAAAMGEPPTPLPAHLIHAFEDGFFPSVFLQPMRSKRAERSICALGRFCRDSDPAWLWRRLVGPFVVGRFLNPAAESNNRVRLGVALKLDQAASSRRLSG